MDEDISSGSLKSVGFRNFGPHFFQRNSSFFAKNVLWRTLTLCIDDVKHTIRKVKFSSRNLILTKLYNFLGKSKLSTTKKCKTSTFSRTFFTIKNSNCQKSVIQSTNHTWNYKDLLFYCNQLAESSSPLHPL